MFDPNSEVSDKPLVQSYPPRIRQVSSKECWIPDIDLGPVPVYRGMTNIDFCKRFVY